MLAGLAAHAPAPRAALPKPRHKTKQANALDFDPRPLLHHIAGTDLTQIHGIGPYPALRLVFECGTDLSRWSNAKDFTSWLSLSLGCKISGGKARSSRTRKSTNPVAAHPRQAAVTVSRADTALGAFYRREGLETSARNRLRRVVNSSHTRRPSPCSADLNAPTSPAKSSRLDVRRRHDKGVGVSGSDRAR